MSNLYEPVGPLRRRRNVTTGAIEAVVDKDNAEVSVAPTVLAAVGGAALVGNTAAGIIAATTVQGAIDEIVGEFTASDTTTAALEAVANAVNTTGKFTGKLLFNTDTSKLVVARGAAADSTWISCDAVTTYTPI